MKYPLAHFTFNEGYTVHPPAIDLAAPEGTPVRSPMKGTVISVGRDPSYIGGLYVIVRESSLAKYEHYMGHLSRIDTHIGAAVKEGQTIGKVGHTGQATGPHTHYQVRKYNGGALISAKSLYKSRLKWVKMTKPGDYVLTAPLKKVDLVYQRRVGTTYPKGKKIYFTTKVTVNGKTYVRSRFDSSFKRARAIEFSKLKRST